MSSALRLVSGAHSELRTYVSVVSSGTVAYWTVANGVWDKQTTSGTGLAGKIYEDFGTVVFCDPVKYAASATSTPTTDVRKVRLVTDDASNPAKNPVIYVPLGTRIADPMKTMSAVAIDGCWVGLNGTGTGSTL